MILEIPIKGGAENAHQSFTANLGGNEFTFYLNFMAYLDEPSWNMDIEVNGEMLIYGLLLKCGCDLLSEYQFNLGGLLIFGEEPTLDNLGVSNTFVWVSEDEKISCRN